MTNDLDTLLPGQVTCDACARIWTEGHDHCLFCGWQPGDATRGEQPRVVQRSSHRQGATWGRFVLTSAVLLPVGLTTWGNAARLQWAGGYLIAFLCFALGPLVLAVQLLRRLRPEIEIDTDGLHVGARHIEWSDVVAVSREGGEGFDDSAGEVLRTIHAVSPMLASVAAFGMGRGMVSVACLPLLVLLYFLLPAVLLLSPFHPRVRITLASGECIVVRDPAAGRSLANGIQNRIASLGRAE